MTISEILPDVDEVKLNRSSHIKFFQSCLTLLPAPYAEIDTSRLTAIYFSIVGLDLLNALDTIDKQQVIDYIYLLQIHPPTRNGPASTGCGQFGFIGGTFINHTSCSSCNSAAGKYHIPKNITGYKGQSSVGLSAGIGSTSALICAKVDDTERTTKRARVDDLETCSCPFSSYHQGHLAMTYTALVSLITLGDDLSRVNREHILAGLSQLQTSQGSFRPMMGSAEDVEDDVRFLYCACAIAALLGGVSAIAARSNHSTSNSSGCSSSRSSSSSSACTEGNSGSSISESRCRSLKYRSGPNIRNESDKDMLATIQGCGNRSNVEGSVQSRIDLDSVPCTASNAIKECTNYNIVSINCDLAVQYVLSCITYEGGMGVAPGGEAQGGATYCALASLALMGRLDVLMPAQRAALEHWCLQRQIGGFQGRTNKVPDSCYSFWVGASLSILNCFDLTDFSSTREFLLTQCQFANKYVGGFGKFPGNPPDILHTFYSLCWLSMESNSSSSDGLKSLDVALGICADKLPPVPAAP